jgi:acetolactate synthase-1/2/3 large subunit
MATAKKLKHPAAGKTMRGADMVIQVMADEGVDTIFGYSGGAILPTYDGIFQWNEQHPKQKINLIVPANEQGAGFMAAGYSRVTGKVGVSLVTSGPGATNCVTPVRDAMADSIPMIVICGQVPRAAVGSDAFQEAPVFNIMSACAKHVFLVNDEKSSRRLSAPPSTSPAAAARAPSSSTSPRTSRTGSAPSRARARCPSPATTAASTPSSRPA